MAHILPTPTQTINGTQSSDGLSAGLWLSVKLRRGCGAWGGGGNRNQKPMPPELCYGLEQLVKMANVQNLITTQPNSERVTKP